MKECFLICPLGEQDSEVRVRSDKLLKFVIEPTLIELGYKVVRADQLPKPGMITTQVVQSIVEAPLLIADLTGANPNVFYELALRHATRKPFVQITCEKLGLPFDINGLRTIEVDLAELEDVELAKSALASQVAEIQKGHTPDTPVSVAMADSLLGGDSNALAVFLEKFWSIDESMKGLVETVEQLQLQIESIESSIADQTLLLETQ